MIARLTTKCQHFGASFTVIERGFVSKGMKNEMRNKLSSITKCGDDWKRARSVLRELISNKKASIQDIHDTMSIFAKNHQPAEATRLLLKMKQSHISPSTVSCNIVINAWAKNKNWKEAAKTLNLMQEWQIKPDVVSYSSTISACALAGEWEKSQELFDSMKNHNISPNDVTFGAMISACARTYQWERAIQILETMHDTQVQPNVIHYTSAMSACHKGGQSGRALELFESMIEQGIQPNVFTFNVCISACGAQGQWREAMEKFREMGSYNIIPNVISFNAALFACGVAQKTDDLLDLFKKMQERNLGPDILTFNTVITACAKASRWDEVIRLFRLMVAGYHIDPDLPILNAYIKTCTLQNKSTELYSLLTPSNIKTLHKNLDDFHFQSSIVHFIKVEQLDRALHVLSVMKESGRTPNIISISGLMRALCDRHRQKEALDLFDAVSTEGAVTRDLISFNIAMGACKAAGYESLALKYFDEMENSTDVDPDSITFSCLIEVLEGTKRIDQAMCMMKLANDRDIFHYVWKTANKIDLHRCTAPVARTLLRCLVRDMRAKNETQTPSNIVVVTGQGHHSVARAVLSEEIRRFAVEELGVSIEEVSANPGRFVIKQLNRFTASV